MLITENQLDIWVRGNAQQAQRTIVELVWRLIAASSPRPKECRFPLGDSIGQHGPDGILDVELSFDPFVPEGLSFWEIGTSINSRAKASSDYKDSITSVPEPIRHGATFIFVTPLSSWRDWEYSWKEDAQATWIKTRQENKEWKDIRIIDGTKLVHWIQQFPAIELWLAHSVIGTNENEIETVEQHWDLIKEIGDPPPLTPELFLINRDRARASLEELFADTAVQLRPDTYYPDQIPSFVAAHIAALDAGKRAEIAGRCLIVSGIESWRSIAMRKGLERHILIAAPPLDLSGEGGTRLIQMARRASHAIVFAGTPGGIPDPARESLPFPQIQHVQETLVRAGYRGERARSLAQKSGGNLGSLLRCIQNLSLIPQWAETSPLAELVIAELLGTWNESSEADRTIVENISGNSYGEWIGKVREAALLPGTPLIQHDGVWKFVARYEGWYALGPQIFDEHLDRLQLAAIAVLQEKDPQFALPINERQTARIYGRDFVHSRSLRKGLADSLALLGGHPSALINTSQNKAAITAVLAVRTILDTDEWTLWASLSDVLPLLAEAAPREFLNAVETALNSDPCPLDELFAQESSGMFGSNYMTGVLWALETLAWDAAYLSRVVMCLGELASRDPGGQWANRPANSLSTILLPWLPQTCAPIAKRYSAARILINELPEVGFKLLLNLLPQYHSVSAGSRRPMWRQLIPDDWSEAVTQAEYWEQVSLYADLLIDVARNDPARRC